MEGPNVLDLLVDWAASNRAFARNKVSVRKKVLAGVLATSGLSYREIASLLGEMSYVAVRDCYLALEKLLPEEVRNRRTIAIDETEMRVGSRRACLWLARDVDTGETVSFRCSFNGSPEDSAAFAQSVLSRCSNSRPQARLPKGANCPRALKNLDFYFQTEGSPRVVQIIQRIFRVRPR